MKIKDFLGYWLAQITVASRKHPYISLALLAFVSVLLSKLSVIFSLLFIIPFFLHLYEKQQKQEREQQRLLILSKTVSTLLTQQKELKEYFDDLDEEQIELSKTIAELKGETSISIKDASVEEKTEEK